jgi:hypothetical protein
VLLAAMLGTLATLTLPMKMCIIICFDLAALTYVELFFVLKCAATPAQSAEITDAAMRASLWRAGAP